ncbi:MULTISPECIES: hypothetical protein [unclassified Streptomyces]|uniref:hypothetical protein n=1 Tax=unclassified Streptomyces TaxID=2593676 RepID=UPI000368DA10|nr:MULTISPECIES: hypothetical protein [unclassified Streptomyces]MYY03073.1 hypothetical protein [Streptomyces sp. SID4913]
MSSSDLTRPATGEIAVDAHSALPTLELEDLAGETEQALVARGQAYAREYAAIQGKATALLKNLAVTQVALRVKLGDMRGTSHEYRTIVKDMYRSMGLSPERAETMQAAVRWHVSNVLRRHMTPRELEAHNLQPTSALERLQDNRKVNASIIRAARATTAVEESTPKPAKKAAGEPAVPGQPVKATADHLRLADVARDILGKMDRTVIKKHMTDGQRAKLDAELSAMEKKIASLRKLTQKPR